MYNIVQQIIQSEIQQVHLYAQSPNFALQLKQPQGKEFLYPEKTQGWGFTTVRKQRPTQATPFRAMFPSLAHVESHTGSINKSQLLDY